MIFTFACQGCRLTNVFKLPAGVAGYYYYNVDPYGNELTQQQQAAELPTKLEAAPEEVLTEQFAKAVEPELLTQQEAPKLPVPPPPPEPHQRSPKPLAPEQGSEPPTEVPTQQEAPTFPKQPEPHTEEPEPLAQQQGPEPTEQRPEFTVLASVAKHRPAVGPPKPPVFAPPDWMRRGGKHDLEIHPARILPAKRQRTGTRWQSGAE